jgi:ATP-dependent RNA helicase SUPV3L1/SUV3
VATDAIGMGLNLDVTHVAFAGLSKYDGVRQRRLNPAEMAQIAGRAGRHQTDGTFGTLAGTGSHDAAFTPEEVYAIEEHRFAPLTRLFWREADPDCSSLARLIADLERLPDRPELAAAPEAIDLAVLKRLAEDGEVVAAAKNQAQVARLWDACRLPDFRQHGADTHSRFVARLWADLKDGQIPGEHVAKAIAELDRPDGDIDTLQGRIAAIRSWSYISQRPDWVMARDEMTARARAAEARLSDALHARLTERFVNRRTAVLMKKLGPDAALLPVTLEDDRVLVDGEPLGVLTGFSFRVDPAARLADRKLLLAAAERHLPALLANRAAQLAQSLSVGNESGLSLHGSELRWEGQRIAQLDPGKAPLRPAIRLDPVLTALPAETRRQLESAVAIWLDGKLSALAPLAKLEAASREVTGGPELRAVLIRLVEAGGMLARSEAALDKLTQPQRQLLRRLGVQIGALDLFVPAILKPAPLIAWQSLLAARGRKLPAPHPAMPPVLTLPAKAVPPPGYRLVGKQALRLDMAEKLLHCAHGARVAAGHKPLLLDPALAVSMGLSTLSYAQLLRLGGFQPILPRPLPAGAAGPGAPLKWRWRPARQQAETVAAAPRIAAGAFAGLAELVL